MAADIDASHGSVLKRHDPGRIKLLIAWRLSLQREAKRTMPRALPSAVSERIEARCRRQRARLGRARQMVEEREVAILQAVADCQERESSSIARRMSDIASTYERRRTKVEAAVAETRKQEPFHNRQLTEASRELEAFEGITFGRYARAVFLT
jgi:hypothetical protein